jgi:small subunit ribosomal protein S2
LRAIRLFTNKVADAVIEGRALATEQDFAAEKLVTEETATMEDMSQYSHYVDPQYSAQLMSESLVSDEDLPNMSLPKKGPAAEEPEVEIPAQFKLD